MKYTRAKIPNLDKKYVFCYIQTLIINLNFIILITKIKLFEFYINLLILKPIMPLLKLDII